MHVCDLIAGFRRCLQPHSGGSQCICPGCSRGACCRRTHNFCKAACLLSRSILLHGRQPPGPRSKKAKLAKEAAGNAAAAATPSEADGAAQPAAAPAAQAPTLDVATPEEI